MRHPVPNQTKNDYDQSYIVLPDHLSAESKNVCIAWEKKKKKRSQKFQLQLTIPFSFFPLQLCGLALIVVGILVQVSFHKSLTIHDVSASAAPIVIIVIGVVIFFIAFFGCCGAWNENYFMVTTVTRVVWCLFNRSAKRLN